jgi:hypothetical protein
LEHWKRAALRIERTLVRVPSVRWRDAGNAAAADKNENEIKLTKLVLLAACSATLRVFAKKIQKKLQKYMPKLFPSKLAFACQKFGGPLVWEEIETVPTVVKLVKLLYR